MIETEHVVSCVASVHWSVSLVALSESRGPSTFEVGPAMQQSKVLRVR